MTFQVHNFKVPPTNRQQQQIALSQLSPLYKTIQTTFQIPNICDQKSRASPLNQKCGVSSFPSGDAFMLLEYRQWQLRKVFREHI